MNATKEESPVKASTFKQSKAVPAPREPAATATAKKTSKPVKDLKIKDQKEELAQAKSPKSEAPEKSGTAKG